MTTGTPTPPEEGKKKEKGLGKQSRKAAQSQAKGRGQSSASDRVARNAPPGTDQAALDAAKKKRKQNSGTGNSASNVVSINTGSQPATLPDTVSFRFVFPNAPVPEAVEVPEGFRVSHAGIERAKWTKNRKTGDWQITWETVSTAPFFIAMNLDEEETDDPRHLFVYCRGDGDKWRTVVITGEQARTNRLLNGLSKHGISIIGERLSSVASFLDANITQNFSNFPKGQAAWSLGFKNLKNDNPPGVLLGETYFSKGNKPIQIRDAESLRQDLPDGLAIYTPRADGEGDSQRAKAFRKGGDREGQRELMLKVSQYDVVMLYVYASLAALIIRILSETAQNFILDLSYDTSHGKSIVLWIAASLYGYPGMSDFSIVMNWWATRNYLEASAAMMNDLPIFIDETMRAPKPDDVSGLIYDFANGGTKGRLNPDGSPRPTFTLRGAMMTTGEHRITRIGSRRAAGASARAIEIVASPFEGQSDDKGAEVKEYAKAATTHFGHIGEEWVQHILDSEDDWQSWRERFEETRKRYASDPRKGGGNAVAGRLSDSLAIIDTAAWIIGQTDILPVEYADPCETFWPQIRAGAKNADTPDEARRFIWEWAGMHPSAFYGGRYDPDERIPPTGQYGIVGYWETNNPDWEWIGFTDAALKKILADHEFATSIIDRWKDRGWLVGSKSKDHPDEIQKTIWDNGSKNRQWLTCLSREALSDLADEPETEARKPSSGVQKAPE